MPEELNVRSAVHHIRRDGKTYESHVFVPVAPHPWKNRCILCSSYSPKLYVCTKCRHSIKQRKESHDPADA